MAYTLAEHRHRFAVWAAGRAAGRGLFGADVALAAITEIDLRQFLELPDLLPEPDVFDQVHAQWRAAMMEVPGVHPLGERFTHGRAAKLINVYLKAGLVCAHTGPGPQAPELFARIAAVHPPIDRRLLSALAEEDAVHADEWRGLRNRGWTNFDSCSYQSAVDGIRRLVGRQPLWMVEEHWSVVATVSAD